MSMSVKEYNGWLAYFKIKEEKQSAGAIERMQIREYGKKINDETRSRRSR